MKILREMCILILCGLIQQSLAQDLPDIIIGDPNEADNDILGPPLSEKEFKKSLNLTMEILDLRQDPITTSNFYQGDIMVQSEDQLLQILANDPKGQLSAIRNPQMTWPNAVIPYVISASYNNNERSVIARAMAEYHSRTCIRFVPRTSQHRDYIHILRGQGCSSTVGRAGGQQVVSLGNGCVHYGVILHELMHAAGFWHEQSRSDRDSHVVIYRNNIISGLEYNFDKLSSDVTMDMGLPYDYSSIMHYGPYAFSRNGAQTIAPRRSGVTIGQRNGFSELDVRGLNLLYSCSGEVRPTPGPNPRECRDSRTSCSRWASRGFCTRNPRYMLVMCEKSCNVCRIGNCSDQNNNCSSWARRGECTRNPAYMLQYCRRACGRC